MSSNPLVGTWRLLSWENRTLEGEVSHPLGEKAEEAGAAETFVSYCGRYEFHGETVLHRVELSLFPNWIGVVQERLVEISGDRLTLSTRPLLLQGRQQTAHLLWERA
jgi:Lipocalin-like domain